MNQNRRNNLARRGSALALLLALSGTGLAACQEKQGPLERTGEKIDEKVNDAKRAVEDAAD